MQYSHAILRTPGANFADGLTTAECRTPEHSGVMALHQQYANELVSAGLMVTILETLPEFPDAYFVEDVAVVTPEVAVITRPGAAARRGEAAFIEPVLARFRPTARIVEPGTIDGGDVLVAGRRVMVGLSSRTNPEGLQQLTEILSPHGYHVVAIPVRTGLHFRSSVSLVSDDSLLVTQKFASEPELAAFRRIVVSPGDDYSANVLWINDRILIPADYPRTQRLLEPLGKKIVELDVSEIRKMDGGLTCLSLRLGQRDDHPA